MKYLPILFMIFYFFGCASMTDVLKDKENGTAQVYPVTYDQAWEISMTVLRWEDCETIEEHKMQGYMLTTVGENLVSAGSLVGVWVDKVDENNSKVTVVTKRKVQTNVATGLTETTFQRRFAQAVDIFKQSGGLPIEPPASN